MLIGVPKEIKDQESRVSCTPAAANQFVLEGHTVLVETGAGLESGFTDQEYIEAGAIILDDAADVWAKADMIYKVKEPITSEYKYLREGLIVYAYLHLAADSNLTKELVDNKCVAIAFETVQVGSALPLLKPMSEVAGRMAIQEGARLLTKPCGGKGMVLQGVPGVAPAHVVILGAGTVGTAATRIAVGMGARVTVLDTNVDRLAEVGDIFIDKIETLISNSFNIAKVVKDADMVVSSVLIPGHKAPQLITEAMVQTMEPGSVIVDVAIDQGGSTELTANKEADYHAPIFIRHGIVHYLVANIPGTVPRTSTQALSNATTRYALAIANLGWKQACRKYPELASGINTAEGYVTYKPVAEDLNYELKNIQELINNKQIYLLQSKVRKNG
ncbi:MAG: alanine dehydrogenase [Clostridiaceae bacterium]|jgi:alanine dehydrogenase|nr:alanine dehydrogenase [Clostridiaceae bacterium]